MTLGASLDRRTFLAAAGAASLTGCKREGSQSVRILYADAPGTASHSLLLIFARMLAKFGLDARIEAIPRGSGKLAAQMLAEAPRDGSVVSQLYTGLLYTQLLPEKGGRIDLSQFEWIGNYLSEQRALVVSAKSGVSRFDQLLHRNQPIIVPAGSARGSIFYEAAIIRHLTGARIKAIPGFQGGARSLAVISGEVDGMLGTLDGMMNLFDIPGTRILLRMASAPLAAGTPGVPPEGVPSLRDVAHGPDTEPLVQLMDNYAQLGRMMALPPGTPAPIVDQWRQRFVEVLADPVFVRQAAALGVRLHYRSGPTVAGLLKALTARQPEIEPALRRALATQA